MTITAQELRADLKFHEHESERINGSPLGKNVEYAAKHSRLAEVYRLALVGMESQHVVRAAKTWWLSGKPIAWTIQEYLASPETNHCQTDSTRALAIEVAAAQITDRV